MDSPTTAGSGSPPKWTLEEYKILVEERRFMMTRYMQAFALYLAIISLTLREFLLATTPLHFVSLWVFLTFIHTLAIWGSLQFRKFTNSAIEREATLAQKLNFLRAGSLEWGYGFSFCFFVLAEVLVTVLLVVRLWPHCSLVARLIGAY